MVMEKENHQLSNQKEINKVAQEMISSVIIHINNGNLERAVHDASLYIESLEKNRESHKPLDSALSFLHILKAFVHRIWKDQENENFDKVEMTSHILAVQEITSHMTCDDQVYTQNLIDIIQHSQQSGDILIHTFIEQAFS